MAEKIYTIGSITKAQENNQTPPGHRREGRLRRSWRVMIEDEAETVERLRQRSGNRVR
jgi:hypothetical protein